MKIAKKIVNILFIIFISIFICLVIIGNIILSTVGSKEYMLNRFEKDNFYQQIYMLVYNNFQNYVYQSGLDENILYNVCSVDDIKDEIKNMINNFYDGKEYKINSSKIRDNIIKNISNEIEIDPQDDENINNFVECLCDEYEKAIIQFENINSIIENLDKYKELLKDLLIYLYFTIIVMFLILILINKKKVILSILIISFTTLFLAIDIILCILYNIDIENIQIFNECFSNEIKIIVKNILAIFKNYIYSLGVISLLLSAIVAWMNFSKKEKDDLEV